MAESSVTSEDSRDSAATAATAATAVAAGTSTRACFEPRRHSPARMPAFFDRPVDAPTHRSQKVYGEISLVIFCNFCLSDLADEDTSRLHRNFNDDRIHDYREIPLETRRFDVGSFQIKHDLWLNLLNEFLSCLYCPIDSESIFLS